MLLWSGQTVSEIGSQITVLALPLVAVVVLRASTFQIGLLSAAETSAYLLVSLPAGALVGRALALLLAAARHARFPGHPAAPSPGITSAYRWQPKWRQGWRFSPGSTRCPGG